MKFAEINEIFSAKVAEYLNNGYVIHPYTMAGHQGEIAKVDLNNGHEVVRIWLEEKHAEGVFFRHGVVLTIGRTTDEKLVDTRNYRWSDTMWSNRLEVVEQFCFWQMVDKNHREIDFYIEGEAGIEAMKVRQKRNEERYIETEEVHFDKRMYRIALKLVRRTPFNKTKRLADIEDFWKVGKPGEKQKYYAKVKGYKVAIA